MFIYNVCLILLYSGEVFLQPMVGRRVAMETGRGQNHWQENWVFRGCFNLGMCNNPPGPHHHNSFLLRAGLEPGIPVREEGALTRNAKGYSL